MVVSFGLMERQGDITYSFRSCRRSILRALSSPGQWFIVAVVSDGGPLPFLRCLDPLLRSFGQWFLFAVVNDGGPLLFMRCLDPLPRTSRFMLAELQVDFYLHIGREAVDSLKNWMVGFNFFLDVQKKRLGVADGFRTPLDIRLLAVGSDPSTIEVGNRICPLAFCQEGRHWRLVFVPIVAIVFIVVHLAIGL